MYTSSSYKVLLGGKNKWICSSLSITKLKTTVSLTAVKSMLLGVPMEITLLMLLRETNFGTGKMTGGQETSLI